jgi:hypothetical protein
VSAALAAVRSREEQETLLGDDEEADGEGCVGLTDHVHFTPNPHSNLPVYKTIHRSVVGSLHHAIHCHSSAI